MAAQALALLRELSRLEAPLEELRALHSVLQTVPLGELRAPAAELRLGPLFSLLHEDHREQTTLCVSILERLLQAMEPVHIARNLGADLQKGLTHPDDSVKILTLSQVGRIVENSDAVTEILNNGELLKQIVYCIGGDNLSVAKAAIKSLSKISLTQAGLEALFESNLLDDLKRVMKTNDIVRYRVYELIVEISSVSPESLTYCTTSGLVTQLLRELTGEDVLVRATCIEMVTSLAYTHHGRQYLAQEGVIDQISNIIVGADSDPFSSFYLPGFVKFFGNLAIMDSPQQICERYPVFVEKVFEMTESQDPTMIGVAVDTVGILGSNIEGKQVLQKTGTRFERLLMKIGYQAKNASTELKIRCLDAISSIFYIPPEQQTEDLLRMTESWFSALSRDPLELFRGISNQPFPELHCAALKVFTAIANQPWAQKLMFNSPGFVEYVMDRSVEHDKASKDAKYELVKALANSKTVAEIFGNPNYLRLRTYLSEGPYYVKPISTTAVEGAE
ncbi:26S proteasome non-ATPase regulatory subunit 5 isoform X1 [Canis lupus familiaris]|uniref:26S proteasome non-ATPase regulatory subunit 5 n=3 Tax=Canis lupus TaxID=9612 RepID=A0A8C0YVI8_CANLF|nr:26S proteasome non-ATPase regulatory subunit 5 isoform X1 [Canis lupus familiaris]XP_025288433.1 26S proteasome non-ATPase regulatory subunit 5 isoform X1 [Canis lupus dingo]XP_038409177.1 26S proteasome non-ATPase regulatory subunit 5 isoform X1 [Canis lupus familiaris]XP_038538509.1 26S proteasome non-ATPase regulatory subunit 5 isoform X1 [Canis lupus familiaris]